MLPRFAAALSLQFVASDGLVGSTPLETFELAAIDRRARAARIPLHTADVKKQIVLAIGVSLSVAALATPAFAQLNGQHLKGIFGLKAGTQAPAGTYVTAPMLYFYNADDVRNQNGDQVPTNGASIAMTLFGGGATYVSSTKIFGGNYSASLFVAGLNNALQATEINAETGAGLTDSYVQPISLGWHFSRVDTVAGFMLFVPTGRYAHRATNNTGLGMWGEELQGGTTVYLNAAKKYHASTMATLDFEGDKKDSETKPGKILNLEGGVGADFLGGGVTTGIVYYTTLKLTSDQFEDAIVGNLVLGKNRVFALGPEVTLALAMHKTVYGFMTARYEKELHAQTTTQGNVFLLSVTLLAKPVATPKP